MKLVIAVAVLLCLGVSCAERTFSLRSLAARGAGGENQRYWFLGAARKGSNTIQAVQVPLAAADVADDDDEDGNYGQQGGVFSIVQDDEDDENSYNDDNDEDSFESNDDDYESELNGNFIEVIPLSAGNAMFSRRRENSGLIELEQRDVDDDDDEDTGETEIFLPRQALEGIPDGSVVAFLDDSESTGRAGSYYRRKRIGAPKRRRRKNGGKRRRGGNRRRRRPTIRVIRNGRPVRRGGNRRRRPNVIRV